MDFVRQFLILNGFEADGKYWFVKDGNVVHIMENVNCYEVHFKNKEGTMTSDNMNIYWLIGVLWYYDIVPDPKMPN